VAARLKQSSDDVKRAIQDLGRSALAKGATMAHRANSSPRLLRYLRSESCWNCGKLKRLLYNFG
jgi:hypothetical protein